MKVKDRLRLLRKILSLTHEQIAKHLQVGRSTLAGVEREFYNIGNAPIQLLKERLGVNPDWLEGKSPVLFENWQKGLAIIKNKNMLTRLELLFLFEVMQSVFSYSETRQEFVLTTPPRSPFP